MSALEARKQSVEAEIATLPQETPLRLHPGLSAIYRRKVEQLAEALNADETTRLEAAEALRGLITAITPVDGDELSVELVGELTGIMALGDADAKKPRHFHDEACSTTLVAGTGFEPVTFRL